MLFYSFFKTLVGKEVSAYTSQHLHFHLLLTTSHPPPLSSPQITVELKNDLAITGTLHSVDQYLNVKLNNIKVVDEEKYPHMMSVRNCFIRGSVVRYVRLPPGSVDIEVLHDATRREARGG